MHLEYLPGADKVGLHDQGIIQRILPKLGSFISPHSAPVRSSAFESVKITPRIRNSTFKGTRLGIRSIGIVVNSAGHI